MEEDENEVTVKKQRREEYEERVTTLKWKKKQTKIFKGKNRQDKTRQNVDDFIVLEMDDDKDWVKHKDVETVTRSEEDCIDIN